MNPVNSCYISATLLTLLIKSSHFPPTRGNRPEKQKAAQIINEKPDNYLLRIDEVRSPERENKKEGRTAAEYQVEEYDTLDKPVRMEGKEGDWLVGIPAMIVPSSC